MPMRRWPVALALLLPGALGAQSAAAAPVLVTRAGAWTVARMVDPMTDSVYCAARHRGLDAELGRKGLFLDLRGRGGADRVSFRYDALRATEREAPGIEVETGIVALKGSELFLLWSARRLRVRVLTQLTTYVDYDFDLTGIADVREAFDGPQCRGAGAR